MTPEEHGEILAVLTRVEKHMAELSRHADRTNQNLDVLRHEHMRLMASVGSLHHEVGGLKDRMDRHGKRLRLIEERTQVQRPQSDPDITGQIMIDAALLEAENKRLSAEATQRRDSGIWWKRQTALWIVAGLGALAMVLMTSVGSLIFWLLTRR